jgi:uncharacterized protein
MKIKIANLGLGQHTMTFNGKVEELHLDAQLSGGYTLNLEIEKSVHQLVLQAKAEMQAALVCDRCGIDYTLPLTFQFSIVYLYKEPIAGFDDPNVNYISPDTVFIDISRDIYDYAMLAIPMKSLCSEECKGLCPKCGTDLNTGSCSCTQDEEGKNSPFADLKKLLNSN